MTERFEIIGLCDVCYVVLRCEVHLLLICRSNVIKFKIVRNSIKQNSYEMTKAFRTMDSSNATSKCIANDSDILKTFTLHYAITWRYIKKPTEGQRFRIKTQDILTHMQTNSLICVEWCVFLVWLKNNIRKNNSDAKEFSFSSNHARWARFYSTVPKRLTIEMKRLFLTWFPLICMD